MRWKICQCLVSYSISDDSPNLLIQSSQLVCQLLQTIVDDTLEVETNKFKARAQATHPTTVHSALHQDMAVVEWVRVSHHSL